MNSRKSRPSQLRLLTEITCPNCWFVTKPDELLWISTHSDLLSDPRLGEDEPQRFLPTRYSIRGNALDTRNSECFDLACPNCHLQVPRHLLELPLHITSIFGSRSSGKTVYLATLTHQLRQSLPLDFQISFQDTDPGSNIRIRQNEAMLFDSKEPDVPAMIDDIIEKTELRGAERGLNLVRRVHFGNDVREFPQPFMFTLQLNNGHYKRDKRADFGRVLCLYDNAGESFRPDHETAGQTDHLARSRMLLFTFDPTQDPRLQRLIRDVSPGRLPTEFYQEPQEPLLNEAAKRIRLKAGLGIREKIAAPLIVVVTKFDIWSEVIDGIDRTATPWRQVRIPGSDGQDEQVCMAIDRPMVESMSGRVRQLLLQTSPEIVAAAESLAEQVTFVPVSAIGWNNAVVERGSIAGGYQIRPADTEPFWVDIPVIHGISQTLPGLIPVINA